MFYPFYRIVWLFTSLFILVCPALVGAQEVSSLFKEEIQEATQRLKWRGEPLTEQALYALALTGISWSPSWKSDNGLSLAWGESRRLKELKSKGAKSKVAARIEVLQAYGQSDYNRTVSLATNSFSLDEIGCLSDLKEAVGMSLMKMGQPERAFPVLSDPYDTKALKSSRSEYDFRAMAFEAAQQAHIGKESIVFALSLLLEPQSPGNAIETSLLSFLSERGVDLTKLAIGLLETPERIRSGASYSYVAADLLIRHVTLRQLPLLLHLAQSEDSYLRGRALVGLGILSTKGRGRGHSVSPDWFPGLELREYSLSASENLLIDRAFREGLTSDLYRVRMSAVLGMSLSGEQSYLAELRKLSMDPDYVLEGRPKEQQSILFPVREAVNAALASYGFQASEHTNVQLSKKELDRLRRGNRDRTNDRRGLRHDQASTIAVTKLDHLFSSGIEFLVRR